MRWPVLVMAALLPSGVAANPLDAFGFGARGVGLGGAMTALSDDVSANYYNPAGLATGAGVHLELGYTFVTPTLRLNEADQAVDESRGFQGGALLGGQLFGRRVGFSLGLHLPDERVSRVRALPERQPRWVLWDNRPQRIVITSSAAAEIVDGLTLGAGITYLANTRGALHLEGDVNLFDAEQTQLVSTVDATLASIRTANVGLLYRRGPWRLGAVWRQDFRLLLELDVDVTGRVVTDPENVVVPAGRFHLVSLNTNLFSPQQAYLGVAYAGERWRFALDVGWLDWSAFPSPTAAIDLELELAPLEFSLPLPAAPLPPAFHDIWVPRVGVEWTALPGEHLGIVLRGGYFFEPSPVPEQPGRTNYVDADKHGLGLGVEVRYRDGAGIFPRPLRWGVSGQYVHLEERAYRKTDVADPVGDYTARGQSLGLNTTLSVLF